MPILKNAQKALRSSKRKAKNNDLIRAKMRNSVKNFTKDSKLQNINQVFSSIDKALKKHLIHRNKAARLKAKVSALEAKTKLG